MTNLVALLGLALVAGGLLLPAVAGAEPPVVLRAELGTLGVLSHEIQFGQDGSTFDYRDEGGQDILFPFVRLETELRPAARHALVLLYQPLELQNEVPLRRDVRIEGTDFVGGTPLRTSYGFSFWRAAWLYRLQTGDRVQSELGISLQLRNANIMFASGDGERLVSKRNVGPVPLLKARLRVGQGRGWWWGGEVDGIYAPISYLNGSRTEVVGALVDLSLRGGVRTQRGVDVFVNLRYLAGGAVGSSPDDNESGDGYSRNWLQFLILGVGVAVEP